MITRKKAKSKVAVIDHAGGAAKCDGITASTAGLPLVQRPDTAKQEGNIEEPVTKEGVDSLMGKLSTIIPPRKKDKAIAVRTERYEKIAKSIVSLPVEQWYPTGESQIIKEKLINEEDTMLLAETIVEAMETALKNQGVVAVQKREDYIEILLRKNPDLDPSTYIFKVFHIKRISECIKKNPEMHAQMKTEARTTSYNLNYKYHIDTLDEIAADPDTILRGVETLFKTEEQSEHAENCALREICAVMDWYVDNRNEEICKRYEEYKTVPTMVEQEVGKGGRPVRTPKKRTVSDMMGGEGLPVRTPKKRTP